MSSASDVVKVVVYLTARSVQRPPTVRLPHQRLLDFERVKLLLNASASMVFAIKATDLAIVDREGNQYLYNETT